MTAAHNELVSLSSPLIGILNSIVLLHKSPVEDQWEEYKNSHQSDYHVLINPKVLAFSQESELREEECPSIPTLYFEVPRSLGIQIEYTTNKGIVTQEDFYGFEARVLLHEIDHLKGSIPSNFSVCRGRSRPKYNFAELDQVEDLYNGLVKKELEKLEGLYKTDKEFKKKTDFQPDKKDFFMRIALGNERFDEYRAKAAEAFKTCTTRGKLKKIQPLLTEN
jgi:peptide deformylase